MTPRRPRPARSAAGAEDPRLPAAMVLLGRTGAAETQIRYCDEDKPVIWMAAARGGKRWEAAAAMTPLAAVFRLCDEVIDGGQCTHCRKPAGFEPSTHPMPLNQVVCWYQWDPSTQAFVRGCAA